MNLADRSFFLYVGTDKAGSTWMYEVLRSHPECFVPRIKDIYFFDQNYHRGMGWYASFFEGVAPEHRAVGELSHDYMHSITACARIRRDFPDAKILMSIREPVRRAFSSYLFLVRHGMTRGSFRDAIDRFPDLIERSLYDEAIRRYRDRFGPDNVHVTLFDDIRNDAPRAARSLYGFLGIDPEHAPPSERNTLPAAEPRNATLSLVAKKAAIALRSVGMLDLIGRVKGNPTVQKLLYREYDAYPELDPDDRAHLAPYFEDDIDALEATLGVDLSAWRSHY